MRRGAIAVLLALAWLPRAEARIPEDLERRVKRIVEEEREFAGTPAMTVAVVADDRVVAQVASGEADREAKRPVQIDTRFPAASVTKLLTAVLVMRQVERGKLALDAPVNGYLEEARWVRDASGAPAPVTLRQILSHSSGLPVSWGGILWKSEGREPVPLADYLAHGLVTRWPPGERIVYSNDGFALAGYLAARADGQTFEEHAKQVLLDPLEMDDSTFASPWKLEGSIAAPYGDSFRPSRARSDHNDLTAFAPAGGLVTTAPDLARFARMILRGGELDGNRIVAAESLFETMKLQARVHPEFAEGFGLGFGVRDRPGGRLVWWDGGLAGAAARFALIPQKGVGVAALSNMSDNGPTSLAARRILDEMERPPEVRPYLPQPGELDPFEGTYRVLDAVPPDYWYLGLFATMSFDVEEGALMQSSPISGRRVLEPLGPRRFRFVGSILDGATLLFDGDDAYAGYLRLERLSWWQTPTALLTYAAIAALVLVALLVVAGIRLVRRVRGER